GRARLRRLAREARSWTWSTALSGKFERPRGNARLLRPRPQATGGRRDQRPRLRRPAPKARRQQVELGAVGAAGFRLHVAHGLEFPLEAGEEFALGAALQHLGEEEAARRQRFAGEIGGELDQARNAQLIGLAMAGGVGRHVRENAVGRPAQPFAQSGGGFGVVEVHAPELYPFDWVHLET